jgi:hypothetical protein
MRTLPLSFILLTGLAACLPSPARTDRPDVYTREQAEADERLFLEIADSLMAHVKPQAGYNWPPKFVFNPKDVYNATAEADFKDVDRHGNPRPVITMYGGYMRHRIRGCRDLVALIVGHELGHVHHRHIITPHADPAEFARLASQRVREQQADHYGVELMLKAGYSLRTAMAADLAGEERQLDDPALQRQCRHCSRLDSLRSTHRAWLERYERMAKEPSVWRAMNAFSGGVAFLEAEEYVLAARCFDEVTQEFSTSHEAWVNRGYAYLMIYCDSLTARDLKDFGVGPVLCGGFYQRLKSPPLDRNGQGRYWDEAVKSFRTALALKPDLALAKANLALAHLFHKDGSRNVDDALRYFSEALDGLEADKTLDPQTLATVKVNFAAYHFAEGTRTAARAGLKLLEEAELLVRKLPRETEQVIVHAARYHRAMANANSTDRGATDEAVRSLDQYLREGDPLSPWWTLAYDKYAALRGKADSKDADRDTLRAKVMTERRLRTTLTLELPDGERITLAEPTEKVLTRLGRARATPVVGVLKRYHFEQYGFDVLATDEVLAIILTSPKGPSLPLRLRGPGGRPVVELKPGMSRKEVLARIGDTMSVRKLVTAGPDYNYYRHLGVAIRFDKPYPAGDLAELILVRIPDPDAQPMR